jgi:hypothetical protein
MALILTSPERHDNMMHEATPLSTVSKAGWPQAQSAEQMYEGPLLQQRNVTDRRVSRRQ